MSAMFTMAWIQRHNEMTALMAAGISRIRVVTPVIIIAILVNLLAVVNREVLIPRFRHEIAQRPGELASDAGEDLARSPTTAATCCCAASPPTSMNSGSKSPIFSCRLACDYGKRLLADNAYYKAPAKGRPGGYLLDGECRRRRTWPSSRRCC